MKLRCDNCHADFYFDAPTTGELPLFTTCSHCQYPNPVPGGGKKVEPSSAVYTQCFSCGRQMAHDSSLAIPVCANCQEGEEKNVSVKEWMVKKGNGQVYGPFDLETLQAWIEASKIDPRDEVAKVGGQWKKFETHPLFSRFFPEALLGAASSAATEPSTSAVPGAKGASSVASGEPLRTKASRKLPRIAWRQQAQNALALCGMGVIGIGTWYVIQQKWLVIPEEWVASVANTVDTRVLDKLESHDVEADFASSQLHKLVERLEKQHPKVTEPSTTLMVRGRSLYLRNTSASKRAARGQLEMAVIANPADDLSLAGLGELYSNLSDTALQQDAIRLIQEARRLNTNSAEVERARAAFALATGQLEQARESAAAALKINQNDGQSEYYIAMTYLLQATPQPDEALGHLQKAIELDPYLHQAYQQLGEVYLERYEYQKAHEALKRNLAQDPQNAGTLAILARLAEEVGELNQAVDYLERAERAAGNEEPTIRLNLAVLLYQSAGQLSRARGLLSGLVPEGKEPVLTLAEHKEALVHLATIQRLEGNAAASIATAKRSLKIDPNYGPALFQQGLAYMALGQQDKAGQALRAASSGDRAPDVQAVLKFYLGRLATSMNKMKDAIDEYEGSVESFKPNIKTSLALTNAHLALQHPGEALNSARLAARLDPLYLQKRQVRTLYFHTWPDPPDALQNFQKIAQERFYDAEAAANLGVLILQLGNRSVAIQTFQRALEVGADNVTALLNLGILAYGQQDPHTTISLLNRALEQNSQVGLTYIYLGLAYTDLGRFQEADDAFQKASRYERTNPTLHDGIGLLEVKRGHVSQARKAFVQALEADPAFVPARRHLYQYVP